MPLYEIYHSYPLTIQQKQSLANKITHLHSRKFTTPTVFVHVAFFSQDATAENYFVAGEAQTECANRIKAHVRVSQSRSKEDFDNLAADIEDAWLDVVEGKREDGKVGAKDVAQRMLNVSFVTLVTIRELSSVIPAAGGEGEWVRENREAFTKRADAGEKEVKNMLEEIDQREDLEAWRK